MKEVLLNSVAELLRPDLEDAGGIERVVGVADVVGFLYTAPLALLGFAWLILVTDPRLLTSDWETLLILFVLVFLFEKLSFYIYVDITGIIMSAEGSVSSIVTWSGALLFGPTALWLAAFGPAIDLARGWRSGSSTAARWGVLRNFTLREASLIPGGLLALALYESWGGEYPLSSLSLDAVLPALYAILLHFLLATLVHVPFMVYVGLHTVQLASSAASLSSFFRAASVGFILPALAAPFAILAAGLFTQNGQAIFLFFVGGLLLGSLLARQLSQAVDRSQQRSRELAKLEQLAQAIISAPPDASTLSQLLQEHVPGMFPASQIEIRRFPNHTLVRFPETDDLSPTAEQLWDWIGSISQAFYFASNALSPWDNEPIEEPVVIAPIVDSKTKESIGGIYISPHRGVDYVASLLPAVQSLAAQISSALQSAQVYTQTLEIQRVEHELAIAGQIQARFLPDVLPEVPGWQLAVTLEPALQTSGDFYDVIPLPNGRLGLLVADVADKGTGAALYMALSRTLIRTYAVEHHARPDFTLRVANNRILTDTQVDLFVTVFYAVLDPLTGRLTYCNAGHNPPFLLKAQEGDAVQTLTRTGIPLGVFRGRTWEQRTVQLERGDVLVLYTDGVTEAQDPQERFFGEERLLAVAKSYRDASAQEIRSAVLEEIHAFVGEAARYDDLALMILVREA